MLSCQVFTRLHERCRIKPLNTDDKNNEESKDEEIQSSNEDLNDLERKSDRNMSIDGASCRSPFPTEHDGNHKKTNMEVIAMVNLENEENGQENISEKNIGEKHIDCEPEPNLERESKQCVIEDDTMGNDKKSNDYPEGCSNEQSNTDDVSSDNKEHDTEKPDNPSDIMFHADTNKDNKEYINMDDHERGINKQNIEYNKDEEHTNSIESSKSGDLKISSSRCGSASSLGGHSQKNELRSNDDLKINPVRSSSVSSNENNLEQHC